MSGAREAGSSEPPADRPARDAKHLVREGWNRVSNVYRPAGAPADAFGHTHSDHQRWLRPLFSELERGSSVLDLGCGCGDPDARLLAERFRVTGVDLSDVQIARARRSVPGARFVRADLTEVRYRPGAFDAIVCLYALIHVPLEEQRPLLVRAHRWLRDGGLFLLLTGHSAYTGVEENRLGSNARMYWSHTDATTYARWLADTGFEVLRRTVVPEEGSRHALFLARKPGRPRETRRLPLGSASGPTRAGRFTLSRQPD